MQVQPLYSEIIVAGAGASPEAQAFAQAFNLGFGIVTTLAVYGLVAVAAIRLVQRS